MAGYRKGVIYTDLIDDAVRKGDYVQAARLEQERNAKIDAEGLSYEKTNRYANYLDQYETSGKKSGYVNPYAEQLDDAIADLQASRWEGWDKDNDESYSAYRKAALREADRTQRDVLAQYAQNTGGIASSAAITAASQAGDYQRSTIADKTQELYEAAFNRYLNEVQQKQQEVNMLMNAGQQAENQYYNRVNEAMTRWQQLGYADAAVDAVLGVGIGTPTSDQRYTNWQTDMTERQYADELAAAAAPRVVSAGGGRGEEKEGFSLEGLYAQRTKAEADYYLRQNGITSASEVERFLGYWEENKGQVVYGDGISESEWNRLMRGIREATVQGNVEGRNALIAQFADRLSEEQYNMLMDML